MENKEKELYDDLVNRFLDMEEIHESLREALDQLEEIMPEAKTDKIKKINIPVLKGILHKLDDCLDDFNGNIL